MSYEIYTDSTDLDINLLQTSKYEFKNFLADQDLYQIVGINNKKFYLAGVQGSVLTVQICEVGEGDGIACSEHWVYDELPNPVVGMNGNRRYSN